MAGDGAQKRRADNKLDDGAPMVALGSIGSDSGERSAGLLRAASQAAVAEPTDEGRNSAQTATGKRAVVGGQLWPAARRRHTKSGDLPMMRSTSLNCPSPMPHRWPPAGAALSRPTFPRRPAAEVSARAPAARRSQAPSLASNEAKRSWRSRRSAAFRSCSRATGDKALGDSVAERLPPEPRPLGDAVGEREA